MSNAKTYLWGAVSVLAAFLIGALVSGLLVKGHFKAILDDFSTKRDTLYLRDTTKHLGPVSVSFPKLTGDFVKIQEFVIGFDPGILRLGWQHPAYIAGNPGRVKVPQNADPFVALLNIKVAQIFKAFNGLGDTGVA